MMCAINNSLFTCLLILHVFIVGIFYPLDLRIEIQILSLHWIPGHQQRLIHMQVLLSPRKFANRQLFCFFLQC